MKSNIIDTINKAKKEYESTNKQLYSQKIRELAYEYMSKNNADTLNIKNGKHTISFHKGNPDTPNSITVIIDNKFYSCNLMDAILAALNPSSGSTATSTLSPCAWVAGSCVLFPSVTKEVVPFCVWLSVAT